MLRLTKVVTSETIFLKRPTVIGTAQKPRSAVNAPGLRHFWSLIFLLTGCASVPAPGYDAELYNCRSENPQICGIR